MIFVAFIVCCASASLAHAEHDYYRPYYHERTKYVVDNGGYGNNNGYQDDDLEGLRQRHRVHNAHSGGAYENGEYHSNRDHIKKDQYDEGASSGVHSSGEKEDHVKKSHDRGFYEREKKYGYEKAYGYERETKEHDKASTSHSHGSGYDHKEHKQHHRNGLKFLRNLANQGNIFNRGSHTHGSSGRLFDLSPHHHVGKDFLSDLVGRFEFLKRSGPISSYSPNYIPKEYMFGSNSALQNFKYITGIHGLGGLRGYGLNYGFNPLRYRFNDDHIDTDLYEAIPYSGLSIDLDA